MPTKSRMVGTEFANRLAELKREKKYTLQQFADKFDAKISTVRDWLNARGLPRAEALCKIAAHFEVTTDWLLGIEGAPKYPKQWRTDAALARDLAAYAVREGMAELGTVPEKWLRELLPRMIRGETLLQHIVQIVATDVQANMAYLRDQAATAKEISRIEAAIVAKKPLDAGGTLVILKRLFAVPPPDGTAIPWGPVTFSRAAEPLPKARAKVRKRPAPSRR